MWLISVSRDRAKISQSPDSWGCAFRSIWVGSAALMHFESAWGRSSPDGGNRVLERCASPWQLTAIQKNRLSMRCYPNVKYASFKSTDANQSPGRIRARICLALASWTEAFQALCWWVRDLESGRVYPLSRHPKQRLDKNSRPACSLKIALLLLPRAIV